MGDRYLRQLLVIGATGLVRYAKQKPDTVDPRFVALFARKPARVVSVAIANKMARIAWTLLARGGVFEHRVRGQGFDVRDMPHPWATAPCDREDQSHIGRIDLLMAGDAHRPAKATRTQCLPERSRQPVTRIGQHKAKAHPDSDDAIDLLNRDLWLGAVFLQGRRHASLVHARSIHSSSFPAGTAASSA